MVVSKYLKAYIAIFVLASVVGGTLNGGQSALSTIITNIANNISALAGGGVWGTLLSTLFVIAIGLYVVSAVLSLLGFNILKIGRKGL